MLCSRCQKNEATVFIKQLVNNKLTEAHVCLDCAQAGGLALGPASPVFDLLAALGGPAEAKPKRKERACSACGLKLAEFQKTGYLGCPDCYASFAPALGEVLQRIHGTDRHRGKAPPGAREKRDREELAGLRKTLEAAIAAEKFEEAARLRDRIRGLED